MNNTQITPRLAAMLAAFSSSAFADERVRAVSDPDPDPAWRRIVISIPDRKLALLENEHVVKVYDVAVGKTTTPSPRGSFVIVNHVEHPTWFGPAGPVAPGPHNPLGTRWMGLSAHGYGIHGTNAPSSIGKAASHGCIRMRRQDLEELFEFVAVGTPVELTGEHRELLARVYSPAASN
jgi:lipoprotein-anchoring transpeptidase ErfK/SrfK